MPIKELCNREPCVMPFLVLGKSYTIQFCSNEFSAENNNNNFLHDLHLTQFWRTFSWFSNYPQQTKLKVPPKLCQVKIVKNTVLKINGFLFLGFWYGRQFPRISEVRINQGLGVLILTCKFFRWKSINVVYRSENVKKWVIKLYF